MSAVFPGFWEKPLDEVSDEMLAVFARRVFERRDAGLDGLDFSDSVWAVSRARAILLLEEAEIRGIIKL